MDAGKIHLTNKTKKIVKRLLINIFSPFYNRWITINKTLGDNIRKNNRLEQRIIQLEQRLYQLEQFTDLIVKYPKYYDSKEFGFNGQISRKKIFEKIISKINIEVIVETGTWIGNTTGYFSNKLNVPIHTVDLNDKFIAFAKLRLEKIHNIDFNIGDSRAFLINLSKKVDKKINTFFYLDAHWYEDLPLEKEIEIICENWASFIILIDDFKVPNDAGYGYDDYGIGKSLDLSTFSPVFSKYSLSLFFPSIPSEKESGFKRGYVFLSNREELVSKLSAISEIYRYNRKLFPA